MLQDGQVCLTLIQQPEHAADFVELVFQGLASIVLPAITIHSAVKYSAPLFLKSQNPRIKGWGPTVYA